MSDDLDAKIAASQRERAGRVGLTDVGKEFDADIYSSDGDKTAGYATELPTEDEESAAAMQTEQAPAGASGGGTTTSQRRQQFSGPSMSADEGPGADVDPFPEYVVALYWSVMTMTTVGYGDIYPTGTHERLYVIFAMLLGGAYFGFMPVQ